MSDRSANAARNRIDKWLWFARVVKSRTLAAALVKGGKVRVNSERRAAASSTIVPGDVLTVTLEREVKVLRVLAPGERRGPAPEARTLYEDLTPAPQPRSDDAPRQRPVRTAERDEGAGRPTKKERREMDRLRTPEE